MGKFFTLIIIFILSSNLTIAQQNIIEHSIQKGENVYVISKKYGVSMNAIFELNPGSENIIYAGRILRVPRNNTNNTSNGTVISDTQISNYEVKRGETKSGLSRRFGVSIAMLEQQNPHIIRTLQAGHIINVDKTIKEEARQARDGEHIVVKGETLWGIARRNGINVAQLTAANANKLSEFLQIGQVLTIPDKNSNSSISGQYLVKRGDTKFGLAKRFNMTIAELEQKNPHIINMLMAGHKLDVDNTISVVSTDNDNSDSTSSTSDETEDKRYVDYIIQPRETLFGLSKKAGMTINEFTNLNPKLLVSVNAGDVIKMPINASQIDVVSDDTSTASSDSTTETATNKNSALYSNLNTSNTNGLYFYTPFSGNELSSPELRQSMLNNNDDYEKFLEFFQGAQVAIDSALALNLNFDITLIKKSDVKSPLKIESPYYKNAILVPFLENSTRLSKIESNEKISVIDIESNMNPIENRIVYKSIPSKNLQKTTTLNYIANKDAQVVVVSDLDETRNKDLILNTVPEAKFLNVDKAGFFKKNALDKAFSKDKLNYVVLDSKKTIVFLNTTTALMSKLSDYNIQLVLIDASLLPKKSEVSDMRYRILKLIYPSTLAEKSNQGATNFETSYEKLFNSKPSRYAMLGFDITLDVILRLSQNSSFENTIDNITSEHPHLKFDYKKIDNINYSNTAIHLMQYDSNEGMIKLD